MSHIIAITNQKGGVGKTTTAVSLAAVLAESGADVLLIDMDPQANATVACGVERRSVEHGVMDVMLGTRGVEDTCIYCENSHIWLMPANADLTGSDEALFRENMRHALLKKHILGWAERFDWVLIDCPPTLNLLTVNALVAANYVLVPIQCEYFALEGVSALLDTVGQLRQTVNPDLRVAGFIRTMSMTFQSSTQQKMVKASEPMSAREVPKKSLTTPSTKSKIISATLTANDGGSLFSRCCRARCPILRIHQQNRPPSRMEKNRVSICRDQKPSPTLRLVM